MARSERGEKGCKVEDENEPDARNEHEEWWRTGCSWINENEIKV